MNDGQGLSLQVFANGGKWWRFKPRFDDNEKLISLGTYPAYGYTQRAIETT